MGAAPVDAMSTEAAIEQALSNMQVLASPPLEAHASFDSEHDAIQCGPLTIGTISCRKNCCNKCQCQTDACDDAGCDNGCPTGKPCGISAVCPPVAEQTSSGDTAATTEQGADEGFNVEERDGPRLF